MFDDCLIRKLCTHRLHCHLHKRYSSLQHDGILDKRLGVVLDWCIVNYSQYRSIFYFQEAQPLFLMVGKCSGSIIYQYLSYIYECKRT